MVFYGFLWFFMVYNGNIMGKKMEVKRFFIFFYLFLKILKLLLNLTLLNLI